MTRGHFMTAILGLVLATSAISAARSDQLRIALVISNDDYGTEPSPDRCRASATAVRDALRTKGFKVIERDNLERGEFDSAIAALTRRVAASPASLAALYYCGYAQQFDGQAFLLPTSTTLPLDSDVLVQGIAAKDVVERLGGSPQSKGFALLDVFPTPKAAATGLGRLIEQVSSSTFAVIGASNDGPGDGPTAASLALRDQFADLEMDVNVFIVRMSRELSRDPAVTAHFVPAIGPWQGPRASPLLARPTTEASSAVPVEPAPAPATSMALQPAAAPAATSTSISVAVQAQAVVPATTAAPVTPAPAAAQPAPNALGAPSPARIAVQPPTLEKEDKRLIQTILAQRGYYAGQIDAKFGPETQAAIRRYQQEINVEVTGRLTTEQVIKLLCIGCLPLPPPRDDVAYCAGLSALYRRYLGSAGESRYAEVAPSVAMDECARGNTAGGILVLEKKMLDGRFTTSPGAR
jgi:hypothetical protein